MVDRAKVVDHKERAKSTHANKKSDRSVETAGDTSIGKIFIIVLAISALFVAVYIQLAKNISESLKRSSQVEQTKTSQNGHRTLVIADNMDAGYLDHVVDALIRYGHTLSFSGSITPTKAENDLKYYDLIWSHDYPFSSISKLDPRQRINHFPGTGFITNKLTLSTTTGVPHILRAFRLPMEKEKFLSYAKENPTKRWIQKSSSHRGISIETAETVNLDLDDTLVQEFMANPLLIDGKKFDIGIYAVLTSVEPIRAYIYEAESLLRFCAHPYLDANNKFNASDMDSYVVGDDYTPIWLMPSLLRYYIGTNLSMKQTLNTYLLRFNLDGNKIWKQIEETIKAVYKSKEHHLARMSRMYQMANNYNATSVEGSLNQFFEMVRFDFIVDENLDVYLMEANMSPNLSSRHFPPNRLLYEQVLNSLFSLVGIGHFSRQHLTDLPIRYLDGKYQMPTESVKSTTSRGASVNARYGLDELVGEKELSVFEELCVSDECHMNCQKPDCKICYFCLSEPDKLHLRRAIFEEYSRWNFKRLLPSTHDEDLDLQSRNPDHQPHQEIDSNYIHVQWFRGKCYSNARFCSY